MGIDSTEDVDTSELPANNKTPQAAIKSDNQEGMGIPVVVCICLLVALITSFASVYSYDRWYAQKIVAVDIKGYIAQQRDNYMAGKLTDEELRRSFDHLENVVIAIPKNRVVIMGDAVVRNVETIKP
ncbi:MAG: hypothetical protein PHF56_14975 [Desulfuromonadaceae bacterium]|nr:hypothetical protein [Desulfuromonadaceae bacterium]